MLAAKTLWFSVIPAIAALLSSATGRVQRAGGRVPHPAAQQRRCGARAGATSYSSGHAAAGVYVPVTVDATRVPPITSMAYP